MKGLGEQGSVPHPAPDFFVFVACLFLSFVIPPGREYFVARSSGHGFLGRSQQLSFDEPGHSGLGGTFRNSDAFSDLAIAGFDGESFSLLAREPEIDQESDDAPVVADEVAHERVDYVVVELDHAAHLDAENLAIPAVNIAFTG